MNDVTSFQAQRAVSSVEDPFRRNESGSPASGRTGIATPPVAAGGRSGIPGFSTGFQAADKAHTASTIFHYCRRDINEPQPFPAILTDTGLVDRNIFRFETICRSAPPGKPAQRVRDSFFEMMPPPRMDAFPQQKQSTTHGLPACRNSCRPGKMWLSDFPDRPLNREPNPVEKYCQRGRHKTFGLHSGTT